MPILAIADRAINVPFHGTELYVVNHNGEPYTPMKPVVEGMGLDWKSQHKKLTQRFFKGMVEITIPSKGGMQLMSCLALRKLAGWLNTFSPNKVKPEIRDRVIQYQEECDDVLYQYWTKGQVTNPRKVQQGKAGKITSDQQEAIKQLVMTRGKALPKECQANAMITMWSSLKSHFGCSYKEISVEQFTEALSIAARVPLEGEYIGKMDTGPTPDDLPSEREMLAYHAETMAEYFNIICDTWFSQVEPALRAIESPLAGRLHDRFTDGKMFMSSIKRRTEGMLLPGEIARFH